MIVILIVYIIRLRIYQRKFLGIKHITKEFPFLSVIKSKKKIEKKTLKRVKKENHFQETNSSEPLSSSLLFFIPL